MRSETGPDEVRYVVVVNLDDQYSIWPADRAPPAGWSFAGKTGSKVECLEHIRHAWLDMRPRRVRERPPG